MNARVHRRALSLSYYTIVICKPLIHFVKCNFPTNVFHKVMRITDVLERNAYDQNEQTIKEVWVENMA